jgi:hypothetical protein
VGLRKFVDFESFLQTGGFQKQEAGPFAAGLRAPVPHTYVTTFESFYNAAAPLCCLLTFESFITE